MARTDHPDSPDWDRMDASSEPDGAQPAAPTPHDAPSTRGQVVAVALVALMVCGGMAYWWFSSLDRPVAPPPAGQVHQPTIAAVYDPPATGIEDALNKGDGQIFAALATDPLAHHTDNIRKGPEEQAYRYQRPAYGWLGWAISGGRTSAVAWSLIGLTAVAAALLVAAGAQFLVGRGADPRWALVLLLCPGLVIDITWVGPETLGTALLVFGLVRWPLTGAQRAARGSSPDWLAVACFAAAGLCRETLLLIPFVLMVSDLVRRRTGWALGAACSAAPYVLWVLYLRVQIGAWPKGSVGGRLSVVPFGGMVSAASGWRPGDAFVAAMILALAVLALVLDRSSGLRPLIAANLVFAALLGSAVWTRFPDFSRVLLPMTALSMLALVVARKGTEAVDGTSATDDAAVAPPVVAVT